MRFGEYKKSNRPNFLTPMKAITALTACMKVNRISTEIFVCCKKVL